MVPTLKELQARHSAHDRYSFAALAQVLALAGEDQRARLEIAKALGVPDRTVQILRAAVPGLMIGDNDVEAIAPYADAAAAFGATLEDVGTFDWILPSMQAGALHTRFGKIVSHANAVAVAEGKAKPVTRVTIAPGSMVERKVAGVVVMTKELLRHGSSIDAIDAALRAAVVAATDRIFLAAASASALTFSAAGATSDEVLEDLRRALALLTIGTESRIHVVVKPEVARNLSLMPDLAGRRAFPEMSLNGGVLAGLLCRASSEAIDDAMIVDAHAYVGAARDVTLATSEHGTIEMDTEPSNAADTPTESNVLSLFQQNARAVRAERLFGFTPLRQGVVKMASVAWGTNGSPPT